MTVNTFVHLTLAHWNVNTFVHLTLAHWNVICVQVQLQLQ